MLLVDHEDSFVHTLANYLRQTGAQVETLRPEPARQALREGAPDLVVLSPGPGRPKDFGTAETIALVLAKDVPLFGVCLGLQAVAEYFGGRLDQLDEPVHGKPSEVTVQGSALFQGLPGRFRVGRYHSLHARRVSLPDDLLRVTAETDDGVVMALEHRAKPIAAVQFHPGIDPLPRRGHRHAADRQHGDRAYRKQGPGGGRVSPAVTTPRRRR